MKPIVWHVTDKLKANHHHLSAIMNRVDQAKKEAAQKKEQGA